MALDGGAVGDIVSQLSWEHGPAVADELLDQGGDLDLAYAVSIEGSWSGRCRRDFMTGRRFLSSRRL